MKSPQQPPIKDIKKGHPDMLEKLENYPLLVAMADICINNIIALRKEAKHESCSNS